MQKEVRGNKELEFSLRLEFDISYKFLIDGDTSTLRPARISSCLVNAIVDQTASLGRFVNEVVLQEHYEQSPLD